MKEEIHISHFCIIRNGKVMVDHDIRFADRGSRVAEFLKKAYRHFNIGYPKFHKMDNLSKLGFLASEMLMLHGGPEDLHEKDMTGIVLANASSSLDTDRNHQQSIQDREHYFPSPSVFVYTLPNIVMGEVCIRHQVFGENTFFIQQQFDHDFIHRYVSLLFANNILTRCITGWVELEGDKYDAVLYLVEKTGRDSGGIAIFDPENMNEIFGLNC